MYVLLCSLHSICRFLFNYSIKVIVVLTTFSIISISYLLNSVLQPYFMSIYSIILLYLFICNILLCYLKLIRMYSTVSSVLAAYDDLIGQPLEPTLQLPIKPNIYPHHHIVIVKIINWIIKIINTISTIVC